MSETRSDKTQFSVNKTSLSAFSAAIAIVALMACALGLPLFNLMLATETAAEVSMQTSINTVSNSTGSVSRDILTLLAALFGITLLAWRHTLRLDRCRPTPVRVTRRNK